jgi:hypothetical protein
VNEEHDVEVSLSPPRGQKDWTPLLKKKKKKNYDGLDYNGIDNNHKYPLG